jgi:tetratricopeptide (TPR) repeat protein
VTVQLKDLISQIKQDQISRVKVEEPLSFNIYSMHSNIDQTTTGLNGHFVHSLLLIDVLIRMKIKQTDKQELISLCKNEYRGNPDQLAIVREFEIKYSPKKALSWYSRQSFLYKILNKALRTQNIDVLFLFRFIIGDIYRQLEDNQCRSSVRVYRGQMMSIDEINNLQNSVNDFISINSFFSTSMNRQIALGFLNQTKISDNLHRVLFEIDADSHLRLSKPFADISKFSKYNNEQEILFMIGCVFRLIDVQQNANDEIWIVRMKLCGDDEHDMKKLFEHMKKSYGGGGKEVNLRSFGVVLHHMGKYDLAEKFYRRLLGELPPNDPLLSSLYYSLGLVIEDKGDHDSSLQWHQKSLDIIMHTNTSDYVKIGARYCCIGIVHWRQGDYDGALEWYEKGIELFKQAHDENHIQMANFYRNIGIVYHNQKKHLEALNNYNKSLAIYEKHLPADHPDIGGVHNSIGGAHCSLHHYDLALKHYHRSLQIELKSLPAYHPNIGTSYSNIGLLHENKGELEQALTYFEKASTIFHHSLSSQHPDVKKVEQNIKRVSSKLK